MPTCKASIARRIRASSSSAVSISVVASLVGGLGGLQSVIAHRYVLDEDALKRVWPDQVTKTLSHAACCRLVVARVQDSQV